MSSNFQNQSSIKLTWITYASWFKVVTLWLLWENIQKKGWIEIAFVKHPQYDFIRGKNDPIITSCMYCGCSFFKTNLGRKRHGKKCDKRNDRKCSHCEEMFDDKQNFVDHVRKYCPERPLQSVVHCINQWWIQSNKWTWISGARHRKLVSFEGFRPSVFHLWTNISQGDSITVHPLRNYAFAII